jgi:hypothetical protein
MRVLMPMGAALLGAAFADGAAATALCSIVILRVA